MVANIQGKTHKFFYQILQKFTRTFTKVNTVCICLEMYFNGLHINIYVATSCLLKPILFPKMSTKYEHYFSFLNRAIVPALNQHDLVKYLRFSGLGLLSCISSDKSMCCVLLYNQQ